MKYLCTLFDSHYMPLGLALYKSIERNFDSFHLWILALDEECYKRLVKAKLPHMTIVALSEIETEELLTAKSNRTWQEFCWTLSPILPSFVFEKNPDLSHITYLDSDIYFFSKAQPIYQEIGDSSVMITPHRFPDRLKHLEQNGIYNVQMVYFKNDNTGRSCLEKWKKQCLDWCYYRLEPDRMGDQKYLDKWPEDFPNVCILNEIGAGLALWNIENYKITTKDEKIQINERPLIFYHYHAFKFYSHQFFTSGLSGYGLPLALLDKIYKPYVSELSTICKEFGLKARKLNMKEGLKFLLSNNLHSNNRILSIFTHLIYCSFSFFRH